MKRKRSTWHPHGDTTRVICGRTSVRTSGRASFNFLSPASEVVLSSCEVYNLCRSFFPQLDLTLHQPWVIIQLCIITTWKPNGQDHRIDIVEYSRMSTLIAHLVWLVEILGVTFNNLCDLCRYTEMEVTVRTVFTSKKDKENSKVITYSARRNYGNDSYDFIPVDGGPSAYLNKDYRQLWGIRRVSARRSKIHLFIIVICLFFLYKKARGR